jgi:hypothetical protein
MSRMAPEEAGAMLQMYIKSHEKLQGMGAPLWACQNSGDGSSENQIKGSGVSQASLFSGR